MLIDMGEAITKSVKPAYMGIYRKSTIFAYEKLAIFVSTPKSHINHQLIAIISSKAAINIRFRGNQ